MATIAALLTATAAGGLAWVLLEIFTTPRVTDPELGHFEVERRDAIREASSTYRWFEPWIDDLAAGIGKAPDKLENIAKALVGAGDRIPWKPAEFVATKRVESVLAAIAGLLFGWMFGGMIGAIFFGVMTFCIYEMLSKRMLVSRALKRQTQLKRRFATAVDLMALMMEVGGGFQESLKVAANESKGHPLGDELSTVLRDIEHGRMRKDAFRDLVDRVSDEDVSEIVMSIIEGEELGTPLAQILRTQADQLRQKRTQWAEKAVEESQVALVFPAMVIMIACLITVAAPFVLSAINTGAGS